MDDVRRKHSEDLRAAKRLSESHEERGNVERSQRRELEAQVQAADRFDATLTNTHVLWR
jgi:hypothetical protein